MSVLLTVELLGKGAQAFTQDLAFLVSLGLRLRRGTRIFTRARSHKLSSIGGQPWGATGRWYCYVCRYVVAAVWESLGLRENDVDDQKVREGLGLGLGGEQDRVFQSDLFIWEFI